MDASKEKCQTSKSPPKLKIFQTTQRNLDSVGITPSLLLQPCPFNVKIAIGFLITSSHAICNLAFILFEAKTFSELTQTTYMGSLAVLIFFSLIIVISNVEKLFQVISDCENLVNATLKHSASRPVFSETARFERKLSRLIFFVMLKVTPFCVIVPWYTYVLFVCFIVGAGDTTFELPIPIWLPFNRQNPFGFVLAFAVEYTMIGYATKIGACIIALGIGDYLFIMAMSKCIKQTLFTISHSTRSETERKLIREQLIEYIEFDSSAKRLVNHISDLFRQLITILFLWSLITVSGALLMIQLQILHHSDNLAVLSITALQVFYAFGLMFFTCELSQRVHIAFDECNDMIVQFEWYLWPTEIQRMLPFVVHFAQQPVHIKCFGNIACNGRTFAYVIRTAFSFFMVLRRLYD